MPQRNEGEGSRTADRDYNRRTRAYVKTGRARKAARKAAAALDPSKGTEMREAEIKGKAAARGEDPKLYQKGVPGLDPKPDSDLD
ncbi:MAG TPA: hypothetical protein VIF14_06130 [Alphaproteobacteria bacterium]|jgi:hypothetical protein